jgi:flagellar protein FliO/FliZ
MTFPLFTSSGLIRWLTVVVGCVVVETTQLMHAAEPVAADRVGETVLYPAGGPTADGVAPTIPAGTSATWVFVALVGLAAGALWYWRRHQPGTLGRRGNIQIEDTRALGNRQFLVVASCDGRRFLLGVASGGIHMLSPLDSQDDLDDANKA